MNFSMEMIGVWFAVLLTLSIFSYLYGDNPFYKSAEHIFVGVSAGYIFAITFWDTICIIPLLLGIFMLLRLSKKYSWLSRISIAYIVGMAAGLKFYVFLNSNLIIQIKSSMLDFNTDIIGIINQIIILIGVISGLVYFFFSKEHKGTIGKISKVGIYFLMIKFGASFGFAVMGRVSLLIGRFEELIKYSSKEYSYSTPIILISMVIILTIWSVKETKNDKLKQINKR